MVLHSFYWRYAGSQVAVTGDFDQWAGTTKMQKTDDGHFVKVIDLPANTKIYYKFIVDGDWTIDGEALKEGEGARENNFIMTGAAHENEFAIASSSAAGAALPVLGNGASYVSPESQSERTLGTTSDDIAVVHPAEMTSPNAPGPNSTSGAAQTATDADTQSSSGNTVSGDSSVPSTTTQAKDTATGALGVAGGLIAGGLATGAAALGLSSTQSSENVEKSIPDSESSVKPAASGVAAIEADQTSTGLTSNPSKVDHDNTAPSAQVSSTDDIAGQVKSKAPEALAVASGFAAGALATGAAALGLSNSNKDAEKSSTGAASSTTPLSSMNPAKELEHAPVLPSVSAVHSRPAEASMEGSTTGGAIQQFSDKITSAPENADGVTAGGLATGATAAGPSKPQSGKTLETLSAAGGAGIPSAKAAELSTSTPVGGEQSSSKDIGKQEVSLASKSTLSSPTGALEQTAVAAATAAATNAYNASGLSGLNDATSSASGIAKDAAVGFTGIGTAVNKDTGIVGTSKIVQGVKDSSPSEDTQTAKLAQGATATLLASHENGTKVEKIGEHAVLAEVGIGGAAIGTAVVTDASIKDASALPIPAQAAEHLSATSKDLTGSTGSAGALAGTTKSTVATAQSGSKDVPTSTAGLASSVQTPSAYVPTTDADLAPPILKDTNASKTVSSATQSTVPPKESSATAVVESNNVTSDASKASRGTTGTVAAGLPMKSTTVAPTSLPAADSKVNDAGTKGQSKVESATTRPRTGTNPKASPHAAAAASAAAAGAGHTSHATPEHDTPSSPVMEDGKKKKTLFKRMKNMFNNNSKK